nr:MAG TPA: hypothetical protein [Caudoviricetes sp.]
MIMKKTNVPLSLEVIVQNAFQAFSIIFGVSSVIFYCMIKDKKLFYEQGKCVPLHFCDCSKSKLQLEFLDLCLN